MRFFSWLKTPFFDYEHEDDDEYEKQSSIVSIHWWAITTVQKRIYTGVKPDTPDTEKSVQFISESPS
jgi:hypothetical protein